MTSTAPSPVGPSEELAALIETLLKTGQRLEELTAGEIDTIADRDGRTLFLRGTQEQLVHAEGARQSAAGIHQRGLEVQNKRLEEAVAARTRELAEANNRLTLLDRSKSDFLSLISHELRTPLNGLLGVGELVLDGLPTTKENLELQSLFARSRCRILSILDDALLLAQIDVTREAFLSGRVCLSAVLTRAIENTTAFADSRRVTVPVPTVGQRLVLGDGDLLARALQALLETAVKFSEEDGTVRLSIDELPDSGIVTIESRGKTVPASALAKFFDLLAINEAMTPGGDLGLGPALAFRILSLFGASVTVANREPSGIRLTVSLCSPVHQDEGLAAFSLEAEKPGITRTAAAEPADPMDQVTGLIETLLDTTKRLEALTAGQVDTIADGNGRTYLLWGAQDQLRRAEQNIRELADSMPHIMWMASATGETDFYNQRCYDYTGMNLEETKGGGWAAVIHPDERDQIMKLRTLAFNSSEAYTLEYRLKRASDGMDRWHLERGVPQFDSEGLVKRWVGTCTDIHILQMAESDLRRSESRFQQLADSLPQKVWAAKADGSITYYNQRWYNYTGTTIGQTGEWGCRHVLHPEDLQSTIDLWTSALSTGEDYTAEFRLRCGATGLYRWHLGRATPARDAEGAISRWFGTCIDVEDYKQAEAEIRKLNETLESKVQERTIELEVTNLQLERTNADLKHFAFKLQQSNLELQNFASVASHDLQEPLRKVQTFGDRLKLTCAAGMDDQGRDYLDRMLNATRRMHSLIEDLLRFARVTSHARPSLPVDLAQVMREVLYDLDLPIAETQALIEVGDLPTIHADSSQMSQLLLNLISNALKFHKKDKPVRVRVYLDDTAFGPVAEGMIRLVVEDNGIGFDEKYLDRIFTVFQRLHGRSEYQGTGIGLAICRKIAQRHGGHITARSKPDQGASFLVSLARGGASTEHPGVLGVKAGMIPPYDLRSS